MLRFIVSVKQEPFWLKGIQKFVAGDSIILNSLTFKLNRALAKGLQIQTQD